MGSGTVDNGWAEGYPGGVATANDGAYGGFYFTNESVDYRPLLSVGQVISVSVNVSGSGFDANDYGLRFINLSAADPGDTGGGGSDGPGLPDNVSVENVNDWYSAVSGSGGFNATLGYTITDSDMSAANNDPWTITLSYTGGGTITNGWVSSFNGEVNTTVVSGSEIQYSNAGIGYRPEIGIQDVIQVSVQVNGAPFDENDFTIRFSQ